jgi:chromosome segregation ATPase
MGTTLGEHHFGPRLNVIIGPNGCGKSTIMCAICIGLGGKPSVIGRNDNLNEYIKNGKFNKRRTNLPVLQISYSITDKEEKMMVVMMMVMMMTMMMMMMMTMMMMMNH